MTLTWTLPDAAATEHAGTRLAHVSGGRGIIHLLGDLGAGKTTLTRGVLRAFGHVGAVKSPTYTLVEPYHLGEVTVFHFDLYRLLDPEELELMGYREYFRPDALTLVEWPVRGVPLLPEPDVRLSLATCAEGAGRILVAEASSAQGQHWLDALA